MLQGLRDRLSGPVIWFIVGIIVIPFAFFGIDTLNPGGGDPVLAKVDGEKIRESQLDAEYEQALRAFQRRMGDNFRPEMIDQARAREEVLKGMAQKLMLREHLRKSGYRASDAMLFEQLSSQADFQQDGKFSGDLYRTRVTEAGLTTTAYEDDLRSELVVDQMRAGILYSTLAPPSAAAQSFRLDQQQRWLAYATFEASRYLPQVQVSDAQVQERYEQQAARFQAPERLRVAYVELALDQLPPASAPEAEVLKAVYEAEKNARFTTIEERHARHILVNLGADKDKARERIEALADQVAKGADFATLASSQSDDAFTKPKGGDLGWMRRGQSLEKLEAVVFGMSAGEVSKPFESEYGWHLVKLEGVREPQTRPFDDPAVQAELLQAYRRRDAERRYQELSEKLEQTAFESPASLEPAAQAAGLAVQTSDWLTRNEGPGLFANPAVREAAFAQEVLQAGENSRPVTVGENHVVVLRKQEYEAPRQRPLEEVAPAIREMLKIEGARARAAAEAAEALAALEQGRALEQTVTQKKAQLKAPGLVRRTATDVDARIVAELFRLPRPAEGGASRGTVAMPNGDVVVVVTTAVQDGAWAAAAEADRMQQTARLRESYAGAEFTAYVLDLEKRSKIEFLKPQPQSPQDQPAPDPAAAD